MTDLVTMNEKNKDKNCSRTISNLGVSSWYVLGKGLYSIFVF